MEQASPQIAHLDFKPGELIFTEGEIGYHFFIIEKGRVQIFFTNSQGKTVDLATVEEGESFGEFALLDQKPRSASARALTECRIAKVSPEGFEQLLKDLPVWAVSMLHSFVSRIKRSNELLQKASDFLSRD